MQRSAHVLAAIAAIAVMSELDGQSRYRTLHECAGVTAKIVPDMNGDGYPELLVGVPMCFAGSPPSWTGGRVRVYSGKEMAKLLEIGGGTRALDFFGRAVDSIQDLDGDGVRDILVGAPGVHTPSQGVGEARIYSGKTGKLLHAFQAGKNDRDFGTMIACVGDLDGDAVDDIVVSSPTSSIQKYQDGAVYVYSGKSRKLLYRRTGGTVGTWFGAIAAVGDVDGDKHADFCVGASSDWPNRTLGNVGSATVFSGKTGKVLYKIWGASRQGFGGSAAGLGELDGDGVPDFGVGAYGGAGHVRVFSGKSGKQLYRVDGDRGGDMMGAIASIGDADGDRVPDFAVGATQHGIILPNGGGYVRLFSGKSGKVLSTVRHRRLEDRFGSHVGGGGDLDQDGIQDLAVTAVRVSGGEDPLFVYSARNLSLVTDTFKLSLKRAGTQTLDLDAGTVHAGRTYWFFGSLTGTRAGISLGRVHLPLDFDRYTEWTFRMPNSSVFPNSFGRLDALGKAQAKFRVPAGLPALKGFALHHAYLVFDPRGTPVFASNPALLRLE